jgi:hypothetical protein
MLYPRRVPTFEDILDVIYTLAGLHSAMAPLGAFICIRRFPEVVYLGQLKRVDKDMLRDLSQHLVDRLLDDLRKRCQEPAPDFAELKNLLAVLAEKFDVALVTTNYDDQLYCAFPQGIETGFDLSNNGAFCQDRILRRATWPCILHLHGSVHFDMDQRGDDPHAIYWQEDLTTSFHQNSSGRSSQHTPEGPVHPTSSIIAGYGKTIQMQRFPFRTYYSELDRLVCESNAALFLGYGFNDVHLNNAFAAYRDSRNRPIVMIDKAPDNTLTLCSSEGHETAKRALKIFQTPFRLMSAPGKNYPDTVKDLIDKRDFERCVDPALRLSFWYNGMIEACWNPDKVLRELV